MLKTDVFVCQSCINTDCICIPVLLPQRCWADDPESRPSAEEVVDAVKAAIRALKHLQGATPPSSMSNGPNLPGVDGPSSPRGPPTAAPAHRRIMGARRSVSHSMLLQRQALRPVGYAAAPQPGPDWGPYANSPPRSPLANPSRIYYQNQQQQQQQPGGLVQQGGLDPGAAAFPLHIL